jgi:hypothetical protein
MELLSNSTGVTPTIVLPIQELQETLHGETKFLLGNLTHTANSLVDRTMEKVSVIGLEAVDKILDRVSEEIDHVIVAMSILLSILVVLVGVMCLLRVLLKRRQSFPNNYMMRPPHLGPLGQPSAPNFRV